VTRGAQYRRAVRAVAALVIASGFAVTLPADAAQARLTDFTGQRVEWHQCPEPPPLDPSEAPDDGVNIDPWAGQWHLMKCASVHVPLNYRHAHSPTRARLSARRAPSPQLSPQPYAHAGQQVPLTCWTGRARRRRPTR
jgi:hypothetical protein